MRAYLVVADFPSFAGPLSTTINDVFADIVNGLLFNGRNVVDENGLVNVKDKSQYKADGEVHEEERDVAKRYEKAHVHIAIFGLEHQTAEDKDEPFRVIAYDGASYKSQLLDKENKQRYPVITLVLYFGMKRWKKAKSLYEALDIPLEFKQYVNDYKINLFEIAYLEPEQVALFKSDFRIVADYFVQMRKNRDYIPSEETIKHVDAVLKLMSVITQDSRFVEAQRDAKKGGKANMCEFLDKIENRGIEKGRAEGRADAITEMQEQLEKKDERIRELEQQLESIKKQEKLS